MLFGPTLVQPFRPQQRRPLFGPLFGQPPPRQVRPSEPPLVTVEIIPKDKNAKKILVLGDFLAGGLAWGLDQTFADEPKLAVVDRSNTNSGLVRADFFDWNAELLKILNEEKPDIIVISLGANDRQQMRIGKERLAPRSETLGDDLRPTCQGRHRHAEGLRAAVLLDQRTSDAACGGGTRHGVPQ